jgi:uncharacterized protein YndB with AHSA1/START domain
MHHTAVIEKTVSVNSSLSEVWNYLTAPGLMKKLMGDTALNIEVVTDWRVGGPILIKLFHHTNIEVKGSILQFEPHRVLKYSQLASSSHLPESIENYSIIQFQLRPEKNETILTVRVENFPTETIYKHLNFYWQGTIVLLKKSIEG